MIIALGWFIFHPKWVTPLAGGKKCRLVPSPLPLPLPSPRASLGVALPLAFGHAASGSPRGGGGRGEVGRIVNPTYLHPLPRAKRWGEGAGGEGRKPLRMAYRETAYPSAVPLARRDSILSFALSKQLPYSVVSLYSVAVLNEAACVIARSAATKQSPICNAGIASLPAVARNGISRNTQEGDRPIFRPAGTLAFPFSRLPFRCTRRDVLRRQARGRCRATVNSCPTLYGTPGSFRVNRDSIARRNSIRYNDLTLQLIGSLYGTGLAACAILARA